MLSTEPWPWTLSASSDNREGFLEEVMLKMNLEGWSEMMEQRGQWSKEEGKACAKALRHCLCKSTENMLMAPDKHPHPSGPQVIIFNMKRVQHACAQLSWLNSISSDKSCFWSLFNDMDQQTAFTIGSLFCETTKKPLHIHRKLRLEGNSL